MITLDVHLYGERVGRLEGGESLEYLFSYADDAAHALSCALPLSQTSFDRHRTKAFFRGLLPEEKRRERLVERFKIEPDDDIALLSAIGGDCAGAVQIAPDQGITALEDIIYEPAHRDQFCGDVRAGLLISKEARLSLTGAQLKEPVVLTDDGVIRVPRDGRPTTHILKVPRQPGIAEGFDDVVLNEYLCLAAAKKMSASHARMQMFEVASAKLLAFSYYAGGPEDHILCVERFDRARASDGQLLRVHQEDFCQATSKLQRYARQGGPRFAELAQICNQFTASPGLNRLKLFYAAIFNFIIGNCDAHGRNFSLQRPFESKPDLAPLYDLMSTTAYGDKLSREMAMPGGQVWSIDEFDMEAIMLIAQELGLAVSAPARRRALGVAEFAVDAINQARQDIDLESEVMDNIVAASRDRLAQLSVR